MQSLSDYNSGYYDPGYTAFGGGSSHTILNPDVAIMLAVCSALILFLPRRYVIAPLLLGVLLIPFGQNLFIGGMHLYTSRILLAVASIRIFTWSKERLPGGFLLLDKVFIVWACYRAIAGILLYMSAGAIPIQIAQLFDGLAGYFLFRQLIRDDEDIVRAIQTLAVAAMVGGIEVWHERTTGQNWFAQFGGIRAIPEKRGDHVRAQAFFQHALLAGSFGATTFTLFIWIIVKARSWVFGILGAAGALMMTFSAATSTPIMALMGGIGVIFLWPLRRQMTRIRKGIVIGIVLLQCCMKVPFWFILGHIDLSGGSNGWDRAMIVDMFLRHIFSWWLVGTQDNVSWGFDMWDACNQFVAEGYAGGLVCFICFVTMFVILYKNLGRARRVVAGKRKQEWLIWLLAATLFAQTLAFFGIDYFDQSKQVWFLILVIIGTKTTLVMASKTSKKLKSPEVRVVPVYSEEVEVVEVSEDLPHHMATL
jgi:hypothetical protein